MAPQPGKAAKVLDPPPEFLAERLALWDRLKAEQDAALAAKVPEDITVTLPDGKEVPGQSWRTTPYEVSILKTLFQTRFKKILDREFYNFKHFLNLINILYFIGAQCL